MSLSLSEAPRLPKATQGCLRPQRPQGGPGVRGAEGSKLDSGARLLSLTEVPRLPKAPKAD